MWSVSKGKELCMVHAHMNVDDVFFLPGDKHIATFTSDMDRKRLIFFQLHV